MSDARSEYAPGRRQGDAGTSPRNYPRGGQVAPNGAAHLRGAHAARASRFGVFVAGDYDRMTNLRPWAARRPASPREETQYWPCCRAFPSAIGLQRPARAIGKRPMRSAPRARRQPRAADLRDHAGQTSSGARHHDRQRGAAAYPRQSVGLARYLLGADVVHRRRGDHDAADRLALRPVRHQNGLVLPSRASPWPRPCAAVPRA